jgi:hypothetical protein
MKKMTAVFSLMIALGACASEQTPLPPVVNHILPPKITLDVQTISLADRSGMQPASSPYKSNHFTPTIAEAIRQWAGDRLQANGTSGQAIIVIKEASLVAQPLAVKDGIDSWFTRQQGEKYIGRADVSIEATGVGGFAVTDASASRILTLPENPTAIEKQDAYFTMLNGLMKDLGQNLETGIQAHMSRFITSAPVFGVTSVPTGQVTRQPTVDQDMWAPAAPSSMDTTPSIIETPIAPAPTSGVIPLSGASGR